jgi:NAD(P)-dependent dehydrogenase (short-subunit alcohol dehydrogenase family)
VPRTKVPVAVVTGAAHGIGRAISRQLLETGWRVGVVDLPGSGLKRSYSRYVRNVVLIEGDVTDDDVGGHDSVGHRLTFSRCVSC